MRFHRYHALGNDYLVLDPADFPQWKEPAAGQIRAICHRHFGVGSDGILWGPLPSSRAPFGLRIFHPDGSEAEKSGNGLRIFAAAAAVARRLDLVEPNLSVHMPGGTIGIEIGDGYRIRMTGAVKRVAEGVMHAELFEAKL